tara:strand:- start:37 stop:1200 length:1164 start_codon:yes stop_codon:yes gene_type:complete
MSYNWKKIVLFTLSIIVIADANNFNHDKMLLEYLFSFSAENKYNDLMDLRSLNYKKAKEILEIEDVMSQNTNLDFDSYVGILLPYDIDPKLGRAEIFKDPISTIDIHEWAYIHWLLSNNPAGILNKLISYISDFNQIWKPAIMSRTKENNEIGYYLKTQFQFSRYIIERELKENIDSIGNPENKYVWLTLIPELAAYESIAIPDEYVDYYDRFLLSSLNLAMGRKNELTQIERDFHNFNSDSDLLIHYVHKIDSLVNDYDMQNNIWEDCECVEEYGLFIMKILLAKIFIANNKQPINEMDKIQTLEMAFLNFQNSLNLISYEYGTINHDLFCLYFANNFNNQEKQQPFIKRYLASFGRKENHQFSFIISNILGELRSYSHSPIGGKP